MAYTMFAVTVESTKVRQTWFGDRLEWAQNGARIQSQMEGSALLWGEREDGSEVLLEAWVEGERYGAYAPAA